MSKTCKVYKVILQNQDTEEEVIFWGYHFSEAHAGAAGLRWIEAEQPDETFTVLRID